jgi:acyl-CoA thioesterase
MESFVENDAFARYLGIELAEIRPGYARVCMNLEEQHLNGVGIAHGGLIFTLADLAFAAAANSHGVLALAVSANISFVKPGRGGRLFAEARELSRGRKLAAYAVEVTNASGEIIAVFQGTVYRKDSAIGIAGSSGAERS